MLIETKAHRNKWGLRAMDIKRLPLIEVKPRHYKVYALPSGNLLRVARGRKVSIIKMIPDEWIGYWKVIE